MGVWKAPEGMWRMDQARTCNREARPETAEVTSEDPVTFERGEGFHSRAISAVKGLIQFSVGIKAERN